MAQFRRRILLINKPFQIRFTFYVCSWIFALSLMYPYMIYELFDWFYRRLGGDPAGPTIASLQSIRDQFLLYLVLMQALFLAIVASLSVFLSHRIAGPLFKLSKFMNEARNGRLETLYFRKSDHFHDLADDYNRLMESIKDTVTAAKTHAERAMAKTTDEEAKKELQDLVSTLNHLS